MGTGSTGDASISLFTPVAPISHSTQGAAIPARYHRFRPHWPRQAVFPSGGRPSMPDPLPAGLAPLAALSNQTRPGRAGADW